MGGSALTLHACDVSLAHISLWPSIKILVTSPLLSPLAESSPKRQASGSFLFIIFDERDMPKFCMCMGGNWLSCIAISPYNAKFQL